MHMLYQLPQFELCTLRAAQFTPAAGVQSYRLSFFGIYLVCNYGETEHRSVINV